MSRAFVAIMLLLAVAFVLLLLSACGSARGDEQRPAPAESPATSDPSESIQPSADPSPESTPTPITAEDLLGVWVSDRMDYLYLQDSGRAELYLAGANEILDLSWSCDSAGTILFAEREEILAQAEGTLSAVQLTLPGEESIQLTRADLAARDQIRHDTGCCFLGDWDMYTVTQLPIGTVASFRSDGTCSLYGAEFTWQPGAEGKEDRDAISIYLYGELYYILVGSETPMGDQAYLSRKDFSHWHSSAMLQRVGTELELPVVEDLGNG